MAWRCRRLRLRRSADSAGGSARHCHPDYVRGRRIQGLTPFRRPFVRPLEASRAPHDWLLGHSWGGFWVSEGGLGASWGHLGASWGLLGDLGAVLGRGWGRLGASWGHLRTLLGSLWGFLMASRGPLEASWGFVRASWHVINGTWQNLKSEQKPQYVLRFWLPGGPR